MHVPSSGLSLEERRIVREGKSMAERMLAGYAVTAKGSLVPDTARLWQKVFLPLHAISRFYRSADNSWK